MTRFLFGWDVRFTPNTMFILLLDFLTIADHRESLGLAPALAEDNSLIDQEPNVV